jgi:hypothetical protein
MINSEAFGSIPELTPGIPTRFYSDPAESDILKQSTIASMQKLLYYHKMCIINVTKTSVGTNL